MVQYIYFVKCPNCEDETFDLFDDAKSFALGCLSKQPVITQTEVCRNDFGECIDHCDLGTVWSWEDMMTEAEPTKSVFTKDDLGPWMDDEDPEFDNIDNSIDFVPETSEISALDNVPDNFRKPLTESKRDPFHEAIFEAIEYLTEFSDIFPVPKNIGAGTWKELKDDINYGLSSDFEIAEIIMEYLDKDLAISRKHPEMFEDDPQSELTLETYNRLKRAYDRAVAAYKADHAEDFEESCRKPIPEGMTIEQLVEEMEENEDTVECTWCEELFDKSECRKEVDLGWLCSRCEMAIKSRGETLTFREGNYWDFLNEDLDDTRTLADLVKDSINHLTNDLGKDPWAEDFADDVIKDIENNYDIEVPEDMEHYNHWCSAVAGEVSRQLNNPISEEVEPEAVHDLGNTYDGGYPEIRTWICYHNGNDLGTVEAATEEDAYLKMEQTWPEYNYNNEDVQVIPAEADIEDLTEASLSDNAGAEDIDQDNYKSHLVLCPECGFETLDVETGICINCGFNSLT
jgi:hypothetical protein